MRTGTLASGREHRGARGLLAPLEQPRLGPDRYSSRIRAPQVVFRASLKEKWAGHAAVVTARTTAWREIAYVAAPSPALCFPKLIYVPDFRVSQRFRWTGTPRRRRTICAREWAAGQASGRRSSCCPTRERAEKLTTPRTYMSAHLCSGAWRARPPRRDIL
ncbi:hypothetical protein EI94DRAFT_1740665 [Lactarius quietus]|nr:hypothetical protein EI94DRAFT_1740665 [Lactarius quietus]